MKSLEEYEILQTVFYRGMRILEYLSMYPEMNELDKEAIKSTIMSALVYKKCIDPTREFLDLENSRIVTSSGYKYQEYPFVTGYPLWLKEEMRKRIIRQSGSVPISVYAARPSGRVTYCIYDANTVLSIFFDDFSFIEADYDSPTRPGVRVKDRPFLEVKMGEKVYLVDTLTKRFFEKEEFTRRYHLTVSWMVNNKEFTPQQQEIYKEQTEERTEEYGTFLSFVIPMMDSFRAYPKFQEYIHEYEESKKVFPRAFKDANRLMKECESLVSIGVPKQFVKGNKLEPNEGI